jgi:pilus assembly protein Flp/PilA
MRLAQRLLDTNVVARNSLCHLQEFQMFPFAKKSLRQFVRDDRAATMVEYALMVALIAVVAVGAVRLLGTNTNTKLNNAATELGK